MMYLAGVYVNIYHTQLGTASGPTTPQLMVWWRTGSRTARLLRVANPLSFLVTAVLNGLGGAGIIGRGVGQVRQIAGSAAAIVLRGQPSQPARGPHLTAVRVRPAATPG